MKRRRKGVAEVFKKQTNEQMDRAQAERESDVLLAALQKSSAVEHALFPGTSVMTFYARPTRQEQFPGWHETMGRWTELNERAFHVTRGRVLMNFTAMGTVIAMQMHALESEKGFIEFVFQNPDKHVFGYWFSNAPKDGPLDVLAAHTASCLMVSRDRIEEQAWWLWSYDQLYDKNPNSTLNQLLAKLEQHRAGDITHIFLKVSKTKKRPSLCTADTHPTSITQRISDRPTLCGHTHCFPRPGWWASRRPCLTTRNISSPFL